MQKLGPSHDAAIDEEPAPLAFPEDEPLGWDAWGRGRGALLVLAALGLGFFFSPWVEISLPESVVRSGFDLARGRAGWLWGGAVGYMVLIPLVWTRQTITRMRGVRVAVTMLAVLTLAEVVMLYFLPPTRRGPVPFAFEWRWGLFASGLVSLAATIVGMRFGGALPPLPNQGDAAAASTARASGETLH
jgi:hypothetical protein